MAVPKIDAMDLLDQIEELKSYRAESILFDVENTIGGEIHDSTAGSICND